MRQRAVFAGSFDPFTMAHLEICRKARDFFKVTVLICVNPNKSNSMFTAEERKEMIDLLFKDTDLVDVDICYGMLADYCKSHKIRYVVRGLRYTNAIEEIELANIYHEDGVETVMFPLCDGKYANVSSTRIREYIKYGWDWKRFVHHKLHAMIEESLQRRSLCERELINK